MARRFLSEFLLPLVKGGPLHVGRPLGRPAIERLGLGLERVAAGLGDDQVTGALDSERRAAAELGRGRRTRILELVPEAGEPPLDEVTLRLGGAVHNLLALGHPELAGRGVEARQERIAAAALELGAVGPPAAVGEALHRHSLLARLPEIVRSDRTVHFWIGRRTFVGRVPPRRLTALPRLRNVRVDLVRRGWLREIGIPAVGRAAFLSLNVASPLGEALDPLRLEPALSWSRILPVLRFPQLCRAVAGRALELGLKATGEAFADALFRFASLQEPPGGVAATPDAVAFAISFLAHLVWLDLLFEDGGAGGAAAAASMRGAGVGGGAPFSSLSGARAPVAADVEAGLDLPALLVAARRTSERLVWPADLPREADLGRAFSSRLDEMAARVFQQRPPRFEAALSVAAFAASRAAPPAARLG